MDRASAWLDEARIITHGMPNVGAALLRAEESRRLNVRALAQPDSGPALRHGMESLEHASVTVRSMFRAIVDAARQRDAFDGFGPDLSIAYASVLRDFAEPLRTFGRLVRTEARPRDASDNAGQLRDALDRILEARARLTDLVLADPRADPALNTLTITLLATADRLLRELDGDERVRRTRRLYRSGSACATAEIVEWNRRVGQLRAVDRDAVADQCLNRVGDVPDVDVHAGEHLIVAHPERYELTSG